MLYFYINGYYIGARGIMPLEIVIFNDNDHAIKVDGLSIQSVPNVYRRDADSRPVYFEIGLNAALPATGSRHGSSH